MTDRMSAEDAGLRERVAALAASLERRAKRAADESLRPGDWDAGRRHAYADALADLRDALLDVPEPDARAAERLAHHCLVLPCPRCHLDVPEPDARAECLIPCDDDCEATCHAVHLPRHKRAPAPAVAEGTDEEALAAYDAAVAETATWCGPFGYPGVAAYFDRRDAFIRERIAERTATRSAEGDLTPSQAACAACDGSCGTCPYATRSAD